MNSERKILIIEDDRDVNELISYNLKKEGFIVQSIYDGLAAQEKVTQEVFDIVVLDIMLPGIDGFRICKAIKENPAAFKTFVVMLTAKADPEDKIYGNLVGADYYLTKPFSVSYLIEIITELITMRYKEFLVTVRNSKCKPGKLQEVKGCALV